MLDGSQQMCLFSVSFRTLPTLLDVRIFLGAERTQKAPVGDVCAKLHAQHFFQLRFYSLVFPGLCLACIFAGDEETAQAREEVTCLRNSENTSRNVPTRHLVARLDPGKQ